MEVIITYGVVILFLLIGLLIFGLIGHVLIRANNQEDKHQQSASEISTEQINRRDNRLRVLERIGRPAQPDGKYTSRQIKLWQEYNAMARHDEILTKREREILVETRGYLPDDIADIIEGIE